MSTDRGVLEPGRKIERQLPARETDSYRLTLEVGQFASVAVEQRGVDVVVRLFAPSGDELTEVDSPTGTTGFERFSEVADVAGTYRVDVTAFAGGTPSGTYEIGIEPHRPATAEDRKYVAAERTFARGEVARRAKRLEEAAAEYQQALDGWRSLGDRSREAEALYRLGWMHHELEEYDRAVEYYRSALKLLQGQDERSEEAAISNRMGRALLLLGRLDEAKQSHQRALDLFTSLGDPAGEAAAANNLGNAYKWSGQTEQALASYERALQSWEKAGKTRYATTARLNIGDVYLANDDRDIALLSFQQALAGSRKAKDRNAEATALLKIGETLANSKRFEEARARLEEALAIRRDLADRRGQAVVLSSLGTLLLQVGELPASRKDLEEALQLYTEVDDPVGQALAHHKLGRYFYAAGDVESARQQHELALPLFLQSGDRQGAASTRFGIARALYAAKDFAGARRVLEKVLKSAEDLRGESESLDLRSTYVASRRHYWDLYVASLMRLQDQNPTARFDLTALQATERWRAQSLLDLLAEAGVQIRDGAPPELIARVRRISAELDAVARTRLDLADRPESDAVLRELGNRQTELLLELDRARSEIRTESPRFKELTAPDPLNLSQIQQSLLDPDTLMLVYFLGNERSFLWEVSRKQVTSYVLPSREVIERAAKEYYELLSRESSRAAAFRQEAGERLSRMLLAPVAADLGTKRLAIVADGALLYLPFTTLPTPASVAQAQGEILIDRHEIVHLPSASVLASLRNAREGRQRAPKTIAVIADPVFDKDDPRITRKSSSDVASSHPTADHEILERAVRSLRSGGLRRLPFSKEEADAIRALVADGSMFSARGFDASYPLIENGHLGDYRILHFATHAIVDRHHPELSGLVLSLFDKDGQPIRGFLRLQEIYNLHLRAELVVLSACDTGLGEELEGEGLVGLTRGFLYAGTSRVIHSLWEVGDESTAELMTRFYRHLLEEKLSPSAALRAAQLSMRHDPKWSAPVDWAAFVFQGDWEGTARALGDDDIEEADKGGIDPGGGVKTDETMPVPPSQGPPREGLRRGGDS